MKLQKEIIVWRFLDGKIGHEKQSLALVNFLKLEIKTKLFNVCINNFIIFLIKLKKLKKLPKPDLIIGVGHKVHLSVLIAKYIFGGKSILIMKPTLPVSWFDLCIIPDHDQYHGKGLIYKIKGALCDNENQEKKDPNKGLILIGGISKNLIWNDSFILKQVTQIVIKNPLIKFILSTSRRTPESFILKLEQLNIKNLIITTPKDQESDWLKKKMSFSKYAWITEDSISMIYESLTSGQLVGILSLSEDNEDNKKRESIKILKKDGWVFYDQDGNYQNKNKLKIFPNEAKRCAIWIKQKFFSANQFKKVKKDE